MSENISPKISDAGIMYHIKLPTHELYNIFTNAGFYRGGKKYSQDKNILLQSGSCSLIFEENGIDKTKKMESIRLRPYYREI